MLSSGVCAGRIKYDTRQAWAFLNLVAAQLLPNPTRTIIMADRSLTIDA
jgi:hypothetical protein